MPTSKILTDDEAAVIGELKFVRTEMAQLRALEDALKKKTFELLDGAEYATSSSGAELVKVVTSERRVVKKDRLMAMYPDIYDELEEVSVSKSLKTA